MKGRTKEKRGRRGVVSECVRTVGEIVGNWGSSLELRATDDKMLTFLENFGG